MYKTLQKEKRKKKKETKELNIQQNATVLAIDKYLGIIKNVKKVT